ncbi:MAG: PQQ-like beta-propeller repeat protein [Vicinamibacterales bacterium]|jgi:outer membrane protein assembly factor BamB|nr:PQQ-like beta-propeller repeat protein [Vicinamibacterales bacterium]MDP7473289.1 PQQ-like beta-propeller repeat protein [Vicinamibacterales bacterium]MDP7691030.1 PQQ-like beta-propeller repeat protein [Vicinamibacterales bacterium]HJO37304.1 PQQ-binding-like beta-propeller repeat protein [Vicinamibacterales bacterium]|tara:strand:- start:570 stop:1796 length:1227 start_codon:yes stop_codon:yes gene_type:complete
MQQVRWTIVLCTLVLAITSSATPQDWPQWRGPNRDGVVTSFDAPAIWPDALTAHWAVEVGLGYATPVLVDDQIFMFTRQGNDEVLSALDAASGTVVWRTAYPAPFEMARATFQHGPGPKSTPTFADGRLFTLGMSGIVTAFEADTGRTLWQTEPPPVEPLYHTAMSPLVDGDRVIVHVGGHDDGALTAFDVATGAARWRWAGDGPAYGSPMLFQLDGLRQIVTFTQENMVGVSADTGALLWRRPFTTPSTTTSQTPILYGDTVIQAGRANGITAFRVERDGDAWRTEDVWRTTDVSLHMTNGVVVDGVLYGLSHLNSGQYFGLDLNTGRVLWTSAPRQAENAAMLRAGNLVFSLQDDANLLVLRHNRDRFDPIERYTVADSTIWAQPTIAGSRIFVKDVSTLALWTVN